MARLSGVYWAIFSTAITAALSLGHYDAPTLANYMWGFSICLWVVWLFHMAAKAIPGLLESADDKSRRVRVSAYQELGTLQVKAELLLVRSLTRQTQEHGWFTDDPVKRAAEIWTNEVWGIIRRKLSEGQARAFYDLTTKPLSQGTTSTDEALDKRIKYITVLRADIYKSLTKSLAKP